MKITSITSLFACAIALFGCAKPWGLIHEGMSREEVHKYLGAPDFHGKTQECWRNQIVSDTSPDRGDYCIYFLDGVVQEYGWESRYKPRNDNIIIVH